MTELDIHPSANTHTVVESVAAAKRHAACDECRSRKLKCSGEPTGCSRCLKQGLRCFYSIQKQMGRPRKRRKGSEGDRTADEDMDESMTGNGPAVVDPAISGIDTDPRDIDNVCPGPYSQAIGRMNPAQSHYHGNSLSATAKLSDSTTSTSSGDGQQIPRTASLSYQPDFTRWADFSETPLPVPVLENYERHIAENSNLPPDPDFDITNFTNLPTIPACACLPNLYLALSTLSSLSVFPLGWNTLITIEATFRTAHAVLYCDVCPNQYQSASNNGMLSSTLLTVLPDQFHRIRKANTVDLKRGFGDESTNLEQSDDDLQWHIFAHYLIRAYVFGDSPIPNIPQPQTLGNHHHPHPPKQYPSHTLVELVEAINRRQRQWHHLDPQSGEFPRKLADGEHEKRDYLYGATRNVGSPHSKDHLCLNIVEHIRKLVMSLDHPVPTF